MDRDSDAGSAGKGSVDAEAEADAGADAGIGTETGRAGVGDDEGAQREVVATDAAGTDDEVSVEGRADTTEEDSDATENGEGSAEARAEVEDEDEDDEDEGEGEGEDEADDDGVDEDTAAGGDNDDGEDEDEDGDGDDDEDLDEEEVEDEAEEEVEDEAEEEEPIDEVTILEAALYTAGEPVTAADLGAATGISSRRIAALFRRLEGRYRDRRTALMVMRIGRKYTMQLKPAYIDRVQQLAEPEIPRYILKTAALIGYHQPIQQSDLREMVGSKVYNHVRQLEELGLLTVAKVGVQKVLATSTKFAESFGIPSSDPKDVRRFLAKKMGLEAPSRKEDITAWADAEEEPEEDAAAQEEGEEQEEGGEQDEQDEI